MSGAYDWGSEKQSTGGESALVSGRRGTPSMLGLRLAQTPVLLSSFSSHKDSQPFPPQTYYLDWLEYRSAGGLSCK